MLSESFADYESGGYSPQYLSQSQLDPGTLVTNEEDDLQRLVFARMQVQGTGSRVEVGWAVKIVKNWTSCQPVSSRYMILDVFVLSVLWQGHRICFLLGAMYRADLVICGDWTNMGMQFSYFKQKICSCTWQGLSLATPRMRVNCCTTRTPVFICLCDVRLSSFIPDGSTENRNYLFTEHLLQTLK